jgi:enoyl-CoA hydratase/carnithine racemase
VRENGALAVITLDSDRNRNALSSGLVRGLREALARAASDGVKGVLLRAEGRAFCSGAELGEAVRDGMETGARELVATIRDILELPVPVIARVHGPVRAGGLGIVAACDVSIAAADVTYAFTEARLGLTPAAISLSVLPRMAPRSASLTFLTGAPFDGPLAVDSGLITLAVSPVELDDAVEEVLGGFLAAEDQGLRETKRLLNADVLARLEREADQVVRTSADLFSSDVARVHMKRFLER